MSLLNSGGTSHREQRFLNLDARIPIYVAANGPKALAAAGEFGDGFITVGGEPEVMQPKLASIAAGAAETGRTLPPDFHTAFITTSCVLQAGDKFTDARVIDETGSWIGCELHFFYEVWKHSGGEHESARGCSRMLPTGRSTTGTLFICSRMNESS